MKDILLDLLLEEFNPEEDLEKLDDIIKDLDDINIELSDDDYDSEIYDDTVDMESPKEDDEKNIEIKLEKPKEENININLKKEESEEENIDIKLKNSKDENINIKLDSGKKEESEYALKAKQYYNSDDAKTQLSSAMEMLLTANSSLEKLLTYIPKHETLNKTKDTVQELLSSITDEYKEISEDPEKTAKIVVQIYEIVETLIKYIKENELKIKDYVKHNDG